MGGEVRGVVVALKGCGIASPISPSPRPVAGGLGAGANSFDGDPEFDSDDSDEEPVEEVEALRPRSGVSSSSSAVPTLTPGLASGL